MKPIPFKRHRFPPMVVRQAAWLYSRFTLSQRDIEDPLAERGIEPVPDNGQPDRGKLGLREQT
jgi:transposase-like protein